jgi:glycosyltransferase involved in cell wall biosynthesis
LSDVGVAVVITAWNAQQFVAEATRSALDQTEPPDAVVVVDDGSTDSTAQVAESVDPRLIVLRREHAGVGASRTAGVAATDAQFVAFLDADDVWLPTKLARQRELFEADPSLDAVFCLVDEFVDGDCDLRGFRAPMLAQRSAVAGACVIRRAAIDRIGSFGNAAVGDWLRWWARARALGVREAFVPEVLVRRRIHGGNNSVVNGDGGRTFLRIAREHLADVRSRAGDHSGAM